MSHESLPELSDEQIMQIAVKTGLGEELWLGPYTPNGCTDALPLLSRFARAAIAADRVARELTTAQRIDPPPAGHVQDHVHAAIENALLQRAARNGNVAAIEKLTAREQSVPNDWLPTAANVNALPEPLRKYIVDLETLCDPAGIVRENTQLRDTNEGLQRMYRRAVDTQSVPDGWQLVPKEPTDEMRGILQWFSRGGAEQIDAGWREILAAAPKAPQSDDKDSIDRAMAYEAAERLKFERWASSKDFNIYRNPDDPKYSNYHKATTRWAWDAWIERAIQSDAAMKEQP